MTHHDDTDVAIEVLDAKDEIRRRAQHRIEFPWMDHPRRDDLRWLHAVSTGLRHRPYLIAAKRQDSIVGLLPLCYVKSLLFGKFLVSLPYVNTGGPSAIRESTIDGKVRQLLIDKAVDLADQLDVRHLELRLEEEIDHPRLNEAIRTKVHMRMPLPDTPEELWTGFKAKVRNKVKKGERQGFTIEWGSEELVPDFHLVFSQTMRDLGTPVFGKALFQSIAETFQDSAEFCIVRDEKRPVAAAMLIHGEESTIVPSAASLHSMNSTNVNDWMYSHLLKRSVERGQRTFDFGRCTPDGNTFTFKKKWGAIPEPAVWQYYARKGSVTDVRPEGGKYDKAVELWKKLPLPLTRLIGPFIVRGIP